MAKKSLVLYYDIRQPLEALTDGERGKLFMAVLDYAETGAVPQFRGKLKVAFSFIRGSIDRDAEKYSQTVERRRIAGQKGGLARAENMEANAGKCLPGQANQAVPVPVPDSDSVPAPDPVPVPGRWWGGRRYPKEPTAIVSSAADEKELERMKRMREKLKEEEKNYGLEKRSGGKTVGV